MLEDAGFDVDGAIGAIDCGWLIALSQPENTSDAGSGLGLGQKRGITVDISTMLLASKRTFATWWDAA